MNQYVIVELILLLDVIVVDLDAKDNDAACCCYQIGEKHGPDDFWLMKQTLQHES